MLLPAACGGDDAGSPSGASPAAAPRAAKDLIPKLDDLGWTVLQSAADPAALGGQDVWKVQYRNPAALEKPAIVTIYVHASPEAAAAALAQLASAIERAPPGTSGAPFSASTPPAAGDEQRGFNSRAPDVRGNRVYSDLYRQGSVIFWIQVVESDQGAPATRQKLAERAVAGARPQ